MAPWPLIEQIMKKRRLLVSSQQSSGLLADMSTAAAYMSTKKTAKAEKQVNSKHASSESADYSRYSREQYSSTAVQHSRTAGQPFSHQTRRAVVGG